jgi:hypothetical protein
MKRPAERICRWGEAEASLSGGREAFIGPALSRSRRAEPLRVVVPVHGAASCVVRRLQATHEFRRRRILTNSTVGRNPHEGGIPTNPATRVRS